GGSGGSGGCRRSIPTGPFARAEVVENACDLVGGEMARGRVGDLLLENDQIRVIVQQPGRMFFGVDAYGGGIIDADRQRGDAPGNDQFEAFLLGVNVENTPNYMDVRVVDAGGTGPAVVRASGPDDLFDFVNASSAVELLGFSYPAAASDDEDLPIEIETTYTLEPGDSFVGIATVLRNTGATAQSLYVAEYVNGSGELEVFQPTYGFGEPLATTSCLPITFKPCSTGGLCDLCNVVGYAGTEGGKDVSYGYIHGVPGSTVVTVSGVSVAVLGQEIAVLLAAGTPPNFTVPGNGSLTLTRYFAVGDGTAASILDIRNQIFGVTTGTIEGQVTSDGEPVEGADVAILALPNLLGPEKNVASHSRTGPDGRYRATVPPGSYTVQANKDGRCFDAGCSAGPPSRDVLLLAGQTAQASFTLPAPGRLRVTVRDERGAAIPAKLHLVGFDPSPDPGNFQDILGAVQVSTGIFGDLTQDGEAHGIARSAFIGKSGDSGELEVEPGEYEIAVSRGPRYSAFRERVTIVAGAPTTVAARIARVIDTSGFVGADFHVHAIDSPDSEVTKRDRVATMIAEGMDFFTPSDHEFRADFAPTIRAMGVGHLVSTVPSSEITTFDYGHFNAWPATIDRDAVNHGHVDWGRAGVAPGRDFPALGSFSLSPAELFAAARTDPKIEVVQINHIRSFFDSTGLDIDTAETPPRSHVSPAKRRLDPSVANFFDDGFDALELWIGTDGRTGD
ncbi:MAG: carboxypeptidase regulatory-like domain-containing protein, partial [Chloroflexi bacterium]|nr:carboxypeptidase regulatory-like domain-containing protein [Chloroflexota bacterium]